MRSLSRRGSFKMTGVEEGFNPVRGRLASEIFPLGSVHGEGKPEGRVLHVPPRAKSPKSPKVPRSVVVRWRSRDNGGMLDVAGEEALSGSRRGHVPNATIPEPATSHPLVGGLPQ